MNPYDEMHAIIFDTGMSSRPAYYSGRGATMGDLKPTSLEKIYQGILKREKAGTFPEGASEAFIDMVEAIPVMSATDFLITLNNWTGQGGLGPWDNKYLSQQAGVELPDTEKLPQDPEAMATVAAIFTGAFGPVSSDQTDSIKGPFLMDHGRRGFKNRRSMYSNDGRYYEDNNYEERD